MTNAGSMTQVYIYIGGGEKEGIPGILPLVRIDACTCHAHAVDLKRKYSPIELAAKTHASQVVVIAMPRVEVPHFPLPSSFLSGQYHIIM